MTTSWWWWWSLCLYIAHMSTCFSRRFTKIETNQINILKNLAYLRKKIYSKTSGHTQRKPRLHRCYLRTSVVRNRQFKQQRWRRLRKHHLKSESTLLQTLWRLFHLVPLVKCSRLFLELNSKGLYRSWGKEKECRCLEFTSSTKRELRQFHVVVVQQRQRNVHYARAELLFCQSNRIVFFAVRVAVAVAVVVG